MQWSFEVIATAEEMIVSAIEPLDLSSCWGLPANAKQSLPD